MFVPRDSTKPAHACPTSFSYSDPSKVKPRIYSLYLPTKDNDGRRISQKILDDYENQIAEHFGGSSTLWANGCYHSTEEQKIVCEPVMRVFATRVYGLNDKTPCEQWEEDDVFIDSIASDIGQSLGQEGVFGETWSTDTFYVAGPKLSFARRDLIDYDDLAI